MINVTVLKEESYLIRRSDRGTHELDESGRGAAVGRGAEKRQHGKNNKIQAPNTGII